MKLVLRAWRYGILFVALVMATSAVAQQRPTLPIPPVPTPAERAAERNIERAARQIERIERARTVIPDSAQQRILAAAENGAELAFTLAALPEHVGNLPAQLRIIDAKGFERFIEVEIEPGRRAIEREWVLLIDYEDRQVFAEQAPELWRYLSSYQPLTALGQVMLSFSVPRHLDNREGVERLLPAAYHPYLDRNHVYQATSSAQPRQENPPELTWPADAVCNDNVRIGVVDTQLQENHPAFKTALAEQRLVRKAILDTSITQQQHHGTAITSLLISQANELQGLVPNAHIFHAEAFYSQSPEHQGATLTHLLSALNWLIESNVQVVNLSLTGPANNTLHSVVRRLYAENITIVAAAGNAGPFAEPLYPAAYPEVIAVTAVDKSKNIYRWANQGEYIEFSAFGVGVLTAQAEGFWGEESGTSIAAPVVSAFAACHAQESVESTRASLREHAREMGATGRDSVFGFGLLHP
ncbi:S8 family serine peptidase [Aliidiomarina sp.]|uniref:S8 family serine peptidase n=1 Tax=Aliidiomarina sp. TaxID=1872439 RepID=UPI003A4E2F01